MYTRLDEGRRLLFAREAEESLDKLAFGEVRKGVRRNEGVRRRW